MKNGFLERKLKTVYNRIKQQYTDPITGKLTYKDIGIIIDERRLEDAESVRMTPTILAYTNDKEGEDAVSLQPDEFISYLLDTKRTSPPIHCYQTYITKPYYGGLNIEVYDTRSLNIKIGQPIAILADLYGTNIEYAIVDSFTDSTLTINKEINKKYLLGAFIQNLSTRWWSYSLKPGMVGIKSRLKKPPTVQYSIKILENSIKIMIHDIINKGNIIAYDVYIRNKPFKFIEAHWIPDVFDINIEELYCESFTFGGGKDAGGGDLEVDKKYYLAVITKDGFGRLDVNESDSNIECFTLKTP